ncbi:MAG: hypothetical protein ACR5LD_07505 [Symbiopectobacterium sp.]
MRLQFRYSLISIKALFISVILSSVVFWCLTVRRRLSTLALCPMPLSTHYSVICCVVFNRLVFGTQTLFLRFHGQSLARLILS